MAEGWVSSCALPEAPTASATSRPRPTDRDPRRTTTPQRAWAESRPRVPLVCLLSPGSDPTKLIEDLAKRKKIKTLGVSMGQGQEVGAARAWGLGGGGLTAPSVCSLQWALICCELVSELPLTQRTAAHYQTAAMRAQCR